MPHDAGSDATDPGAAENAHQERLEELAVRASLVAAVFQEVERALEAEGLDADQLEVIEDKRALAEHELADIAAEMRKIDTSAGADIIAPE